MELHAHIKQGLRVKEQPLLSQMTLTLGLYRTQLVVLLHATYYNLVLAHCSVKRYTKSSGTATLGSQVLNQWQVSACSEKCVGLIIKVRCLQVTSELWLICQNHPFLDGEARWSLSSRSQDGGMVRFTACPLFALLSSAQLTSAKWDRSTSPLSIPISPANQELSLSCSQKWTIIWDSHPGRIVRVERAQLCLFLGAFNDAPTLHTFRWISNC